MNDQLLNTKEAAEFLRVSEASIRRWSDAGLLPAQRVGRRGARRFTRSDLERFMGAKEGRPDDSSAAVVGGEAIPLRAHIACLYGEEAGRFRHSVPFIVDGLRRGQPTFLVCSGEVLDGYLETLRVAMADSHSSLAELRVVSESTMTAADFIDYWEQVLSGLVATQPSAIRIVGELVCAVEMLESLEELMRYEEAINLLAKRYPVIFLCQYDVRGFDGPTILRMLKAHPDMYGWRLGNFLA
ncbi:MAG TPA: MEDS domain-containing protein [Candidatus Dormibacteraeota bacterium]|nr:MEDS domain-containing protein [Candidatus Dormibacteraeota bacterium]